MPGPSTSQQVISDEILEGGFGFGGQLGSQLKDEPFFVVEQRDLPFGQETDSMQGIVAKRSKCTISTALQQTTALTRRSFSFGEQRRNTKNIFPKIQSPKPVKLSRRRNVFGSPIPYTASVDEGYKWFNELNDELGIFE